MTDPRNDPPRSSRERILWVDGVGGFQLVEAEEIVIGQAIPGSDADVHVVGDLSRRAVVLRRSGSDFLVQPLQETFLDDQLIDRPQLLSRECELRVGARVRLRFTQPTPLSGTARLQLSSVHRFQPRVDGVLLLAESCIIGPTRGSHIYCPHWTSELILFKHPGGWFIRTLDEVEVNGQLETGQILVSPGMRLRGPGYSLSLE